MLTERGLKNTSRGALRVRVTDEGLSRDIHLSGVEKNVGGWRDGSVFYRVRERGAQMSLDKRAYRISHRHP